jgi:hypothetical protein
LHLLLLFHLNSGPSSFAAWASGGCGGVDEALRRGAVLGGSGAHGARQGAVLRRGAPPEAGALLLLRRRPAHRHRGRPRLLPHDRSLQGGWQCASVLKLPSLRGITVSSQPANQLQPPHPTPPHPHPTPCRAATTSPSCGFNGAAAGRCVRRQRPAGAAGHALPACTAASPTPPYQSPPPLCVGPPDCLPGSAARCALQRLRVVVKAERQPRRWRSCCRPAGPGP